MAVYWFQLAMFHQFFIGIQRSTNGVERPLLVLRNTGDFDLLFRARTVESCSPFIHRENHCESHPPPTRGAPAEALLASPSVAQRYPWEMDGTR